jgi:hypothetical protein
VAATDAYTLRDFSAGSSGLVLAAGELTLSRPTPAGMLDEVSRVLRPSGVLIANYTVLDDPEIAAYQPGAGASRRARAPLLLRRRAGYVLAQLAALHHLAGMDVLKPKSAEAISTTRGRAVGTAQVPSVS